MPLKRTLNGSFCIVIAFKNIKLDLKGFQIKQKLLYSVNLKSVISNVLMNARITLHLMTFGII